MSHNITEIEKYIAQQCLPQPGSHWKHYKGEIYVVVCVGIRESNKKFEVCYQSLKNPLQCPWIRSLKEWNDIVVFEGENVYRFLPIS